MNLSNSFDAIFDKTRKWRTESSDTWQVIEPESDAKMKELLVEKKGCKFFGYDQYLTKGVKDSTITRSSSLKDKECDGIAFSVTDDTEEMFFAELKSDFSTKELSDAFFQIICSFCKIHPWLSLCEGYDLNTINIHFILACKCFKDDGGEQESAVFSTIEQERMAGQNNFTTKFLSALLRNKHCDIRLSDISHFANHPFSSAIKDKKVRIHLVTTSHYSDSACTINL